MILLLFCLLVAGAATLAVLAYFSPQLIRETAAGDGVSLGAAALALLLWLAMWPRLPLAVTLWHRPETALLPAWQWRVDEAAWQLTGAVLLLVAAALLATSGRRQPEVVKRSVPPAVPLLLLAAATLAALWAESPAGLLAGWMVLGVTWAAAAWPAGDEQRGTGSWLLRIGWLLVALFTLWLGLAGLPAAASLATHTWPAATILLLAAILQMGVWPLSVWRPPDEQQPAGAVAAMIYLLPTVAGAMLLARLAMGSPVNMAYALLLTALALLGFLRGLRLAWARLQQPAALAAALALVQSGLILLAGIWAGPDAAIAETRVLLLATGTLFLLEGRRLTRARWWRAIGPWAIGPVIALAALAGLPLTIGFAGRAALYDAWLTNGRFVLVLVTALLHAPLITAVLLLLWRRAEAAGAGETEGPAGRAVAREAALLLPALGLLSPAGLDQASPVAWLAIGAAAVAGFVLSRYVGEVQEARAALRQAFSLNLPLERAQVTLSRLGQGVKTAVGEAVLILEGEGGLLWLLVLVVIFLLAL